jgi:phosphoglycolate phosphatase-like HAD superfamily hydrolase
VTGSAGRARCTREIIVRNGPSRRCGETTTQAPAHLLLFDIDGTLIDSQAADGEIYLSVLEEVFGFADVSSDWGAYRHTTDSGILQEIFETRLGRAPRDCEVAAFRERFVEVIAEAASIETFREIPGARRMLSALDALPAHRVGLATGGWRASARCKMLSAGLRFDEYPSACADDAQSRISIMRLAIERAASRMNGRGPQSVVYIGDGLWDARACRALGIPFIAIASGADAERLRAEGAAAVLADFSDLDAFRALLPGSSPATALSAAAAG